MRNWLADLGLQTNLNVQLWELDERGCASVFALDGELNVCICVLLGSSPCFQSETCYAMRCLLSCAMDIIG